MNYSAFLAATEDILVDGLTPDIAALRPGLDEDEAAVIRNLPRARVALIHDSVARKLERSLRDAFPLASRLLADEGDSLYRSLIPQASLPRASRSTPWQPLLDAADCALDSLMAHPQRRLHAAVLQWELLRFAVSTRGLLRSSFAPTLGTIGTPTRYVLRVRQAIAVCWPRDLAHSIRLLQNGTIPPSASADEPETLTAIWVDSGSGRASLHETHIAYSHFAALNVPRGGSASGPISCSPDVIDHLVAQKIYHLSGVEDAATT